MKKKCNIIMLPTKKVSNIHKIGDEIGYTDVANNNPLAKQQHLYITIDDYIKVGDWFLWSNESIIRPMQLNNKSLEGIKKVPKIIATTNTKLGWTNILQIRKSFIKEYVLNPEKEIMIDFSDGNPESFNGFITILAYEYRLRNKIAEIVYISRWNDNKTSLRAVLTPEEYIQIEDQLIALFNEEKKRKMD